MKAFPPPSLVEEESLWSRGLVTVAGVDEAGRGPLAGPVVAAAVVLPREERLWFRQVRDSKQLSLAQRESLYKHLEKEALGVGVVSSEVIDAQGILQATRQAMQEAVAKLPCPPDFLLIDSVKLPGLRLPQKNLTRGDQLCLSIAAASIVAKVTRDHLMLELDSLYPQYGFARHKGYGTKEHLACLERWGPCPVHRRSFEPVRRLLGGGSQTVGDTRKKLGRQGEEIARGYLEKKGWRCLQSNYRCSRGEIDLILEKNGELVFVEVRTRKSSAFGLPEESLTDTKLSRLVTLSETYLQEHQLSSVSWRIDVVAIELGPRGQVKRLEHIENAVTRREIPLSSSL